MTRTALYSGSFDPMTNGHLDILRQGLDVFDRIVVAIGVHAEKRAMFSFAERQQMIGAVLEREGFAERVRVVSFGGLVVDAARDEGASAILRGLRNDKDLAYEAEMAGMNGAMAPEIRTVFMVASPGVGHITATLVRQIASMKGDVAPFVPAAVLARINEKTGLA